jgi:hypothetical protein
MIGYAEDEYAIQRINDNHWKVLKFSGHHSHYLCTYDIKKIDKEWICTCKAMINCKHIKMMLMEKNPRKELF